MKTNAAPLIYLLSLLLFITNCLTTEVVFAQNNPKAIKADSLFNALYTAGHFNGSVALVDKGKLIFKKGYGIANFEDSSAFTPATAMEIASLSKQFTAAAILDLAEAGRLAVEDDIKNYLPDGFPYNGITIKNLLSHTGGLPNYTPYFVKHGSLGKLIDNKAILAYFMDVRPAREFAPGTAYDYSNTGYVLLAEVVENVSGMALDAYLEQHLFKPFGFKSAGFYLRSDIYTMENYAPSFIWSKDSNAYMRPENLPGKAYYMFLSGRLGPGRLSLSLEDLLRWDRLLYTEAFLSKTSKSNMFTPVVYEGLHTDYGYGWHNYADKKVGAVSYHTGSWAGNRTYIKRFTDLKSTIIILNNTNSPYMKQIRAAVDSLITERPLAPFHKPEA